MILHRNERTCHGMKILTPNRKHKTTTIKIIERKSQIVKIKHQNCNFLVTIFHGIHVAPCGVVHEVIVSRRLEAIEVSSTDFCVRSHIGVVEPFSDLHTTHFRLFL